MPLKKDPSERGAFFGDSTLDDELPFVNATFWVALIGHVERDVAAPPRSILDIGCHTGGLLHRLAHRFGPDRLWGIEPIRTARETALRQLIGVAPSVRVLDVGEWGQIPERSVDLVTSHEVLYLQEDLSELMREVERVLSPHGVAYMVLGCHAENPLWEEWKKPMIAAGRAVYDHAPFEIMEAASAAGMLPSVQPLRRFGWVTYDPLRAEFSYPDLRTMFDHHYRYKLIFRFRGGDAFDESS